MTEAVKELLERVKAATGPDREMDAAILAALPYEVMASDIEVSDRWDGLVCFKHSSGAPDSRWAPQYTASIDAALALVERVLPGWHWNVGNVGEDDCPGACLTEPTGWYRDFVGSAATPPLAILAALLTAMEAAP